MKKIILIAFVAAFILSSCEESSMGVSKVVTYPTIAVVGDIAQTIPVGGTYVDKGCIVKEGALDKSNLIKTTGSVNPAVPGVYTITYLYKSEGKIYPQDSLTLRARRYVGVIDAAASAMNIAGTYRRNAGALGFAVMTKLSYPGLYTNNNPGGATSTGASTGVSVDNIILYVFHTTPTTLVVPSQDSSVGEFACTGGVYDATGAAPLYKWACVNPGYGTTARTFNKQ